MCEKHGIENIAFFTLTFAQNIICPKEASRRLNSLKTNALNERYPDQIRVFERQKSGRIHYHFIVNVGHDIRTGVNWDEFAARNYRSASAFLRSEWAYWRKAAKLYGFGRTELLPVRSNHEAIGRYVGKYISKNIGQRRESQDKGLRLVEYTRGARAHSTRFQFVTDNSRLWRQKVERFAEILWSAGATLNRKLARCHRCGLRT
jgi:hypothetical protein